MTGLAAEADKTTVNRGYGFEEVSRGWDMQGAITHLPSADLRDTGGDAGISDYRMKLARDFRLDGRLTLTLGGGYGLKHIDSSPSAALPQDLHGLFIETGLKYRFNDRSFASIRLYPGLYSDFKDLGDDDLRMPVLALGGYRFDNGVSLIGGFIYRFGYHAGQYIPALGISYQPNEFWRFDLIAPRPGITYLASRQVQLFVAGDFASDEYELKDRALGAKVVKYSDYKAMGGVSYLPLPSVKLTTAVGYSFERRFAFFDGNRPDMRLDDVPFFRVSLDVGW
jgi:hypothetical protein